MFVKKAITGSTLIALFLVSSFALLASLCFAQDAATVERTESTTRFSAAYPPVGAWEFGIEERDFLGEGHPFDNPEESIVFRLRPPDARDAADYDLDITVSRQWPRIDECLVRPQDTRNQREAIRRMDKVFKKIKDGESREFIRELEQCASTVAEYLDVHFAHAEFIFRESVGLLGGGKVTVLGRGKEVAGDKTIHYIRFERVFPNTTRRQEFSRYVYLPPEFGKESLFYYEVFTSSGCDSSSSCRQLGDTKAPSVAVLASVERFTTKAARPISQDQIAAAGYFNAKLSPGDGPKDHSFGASIAIDGGIISVISRSYAGSRTGGSVYVYGHDANAKGWLLRHKFAARDAWSVASTSEQMVIGGRDTAWISSLDADTGGWNKPAKLGVSGYNVAIDQGTIVVGAAFEDCGESSIVCSGAAYILSRDNASGGWLQETRLVASEAPPPHRFGSSVAIDDDTLIVGATGITSPTGGKWGSNEGKESGAVYVFVRDSKTNQWHQQAMLTPSDSGIRDHFGHVVAIDGDTLVVGAIGDNNWGKENGAAYIFVRDESSAGWRQEEKLTGTGAAQKGALPDLFGDAVAIDENTIVIGAPNESGLREYSGTAYVYRRDLAGKWTERVKLKAPDARSNAGFGESVAIDGTTIAVGETGTGGLMKIGGSAYVFTIPE